MRFTRILGLGATVIALAVTVAACGGGSGSGSGSTGLVQKAKNDKKLVVGTRFDQPGLGLRTPDGSNAGFDIDVAKYIAKELGVDTTNISWKEALSAERESLIEKGEVDFIAATYSITDKRKEKVSFAGPYLVTGQDLLIKADNTDITGPESLNGKKLCSVTGSTSAKAVKDKFANQAQLQEYAKYSDCVQALLNGTIDAVSTDATILAGFAAQNGDKLKLTNKTFTTERIGIGLRKGDTEGRDAINKAIEKMIQSGEWKKSLETHLGGSGFTLPDPPKIEEK